MPLNIVNTLLNLKLKCFKLIACLNISVRIKPILLLSALVVISAAAVQNSYFAYILSSNSYFSNKLSLGCFPSSISLPTYPVYMYTNLAQLLVTLAAKFLFE